MWVRSLYIKIVAFEYHLFLHFLFRVHCSIPTLPRGINQNEKKEKRKRIEEIEEAEKVEEIQGQCHQ